MTPITVFRAVHISLSGEEGSAYEGRFTEGAGVALWVPMPTKGAMLVNGHPHPNGFPAGYTTGTEQLLVASEKGRL